MKTNHSNPSTPSCSSKSSGPVDARGFESSRREFLGRVGQGMLVASVGSVVAEGLGISTASAAEATVPATLKFGKHVEPLVALLQETPIDQLQTVLVAKLKKGEVDLKQLIQAAALSNSRSFGGEDYVGMHTLMALKPAYLMSQQLPSERRALSVLKVLYRNTSQIHAKGGRKNERLQAVEPGKLEAGRSSAEQLSEAVHRSDLAGAEKILAAIAKRSPNDAFNDLLHVVAGDTDVHRVVFAHRAWDTLDLAGMEYAETMLRQSLRYCLRAEKHSSKNGKIIRALLPKLLDEHKLANRSAGTRKAEDSWVDELSRTIFRSTPEQAAEAVAFALAEGIDPNAVGEAISLTANQLVLRDVGRTESMVRPGKPIGSVHGDSIGVHASDAANAWRNMARVSNARNSAACLILGAYQVARDRTNRGGKFLEWKPRPYEEQLAKVAGKDAETLLKNLDGAIREQDQASACALVHRYGSLGHKTRPLMDVLLQFATSEDGALHAEKYYVTTTSDYAATRAQFRGRHLVGLARVTASEYGKRSPGYEQACELLGV